MIKKIFLLGNPNVGKSVVFSRMTGVQAISSNYPGTTVEIIRGYHQIGGETVEVVDLPGTYSLEHTSKAEEVAVSVLDGVSKDEMVVVNVIDATNLERNLYLTMQLLEKGYPVVVCMNMCDDAKHRGVGIDEKKLEGLLGVPVVSTCAITGVGIKTLFDRILDAKQANMPALDHTARWIRIGEIVESVQTLQHRHHTFREVLEDASVRPFSGILIGIAVIYGSFKIVRFVGETLINRFFDPVFNNLLAPALEKLSSNIGNETFLHHLLIGDLINGKINFKESMGVLTTAPYIEFAMVLPYVLSFYLVLSILEDMGYLPRLAILLDGLLHKLGLHGFAIIPVLLGFGCNIPGILSTRVLESRRERFIASTLISIGVPCAALQAMIFALLGKTSGFYVGGVYLVLFLIWAVLGMILNRIMKGYSPELLLEIPSYRFPPLVIMFKKLFLRMKEFLIDAVPVVFLGVLVINTLLFFKLFDSVTGIFAPIVHGLFGLPKETTIALLVGLVRKEVAAALLVPLGLSINQMFIAVTLLAISFPCMATFVILFRELGIKDFIKSTLIMLATGIIVGTLLNLFL